MPCSQCLGMRCHRRMRERGGGHTHRNSTGFLLIKRINSAVQTRRQSTYTNEQCSSSSASTYSATPRPIPIHMASRGGGRVLVLGHSSCSAALSQQSPMFVCSHGQTQSPVQKVRTLALLPLETPMYLCVPLVVVGIPQRRNMTACHAARGPHTSATGRARARKSFLFFFFFFSFSFFFLCNQSPINFPSA